MPRRLPPFSEELAREIAHAEDLIVRVENARIQLLRSQASLITLAALELSYELAFLRVFLAWEVLLEQIFLRLLCGYEHSGGLEPLVAAGHYYTTIAAAESAVLGRRDFVLWHNPDHVIRRARSFFGSGRYELVLSSNQARLTLFAAVRHRIAHSQEHARIQFDNATMSLSGRRYPASRPGRFLRDWVPGTAPPVRWFSSIAAELLSLARQLNA